MWALIRDAYGSWEIEGQFATKREALHYAAFFESDSNPATKRSGTFYEYGSWGIVHSDNLKRHGYEEVTS